MCPPCPPLSGWIPRLLPACPRPAGKHESPHQRDVFLHVAVLNLIPSLLSFPHSFRVLSASPSLPATDSGPILGGQWWELREEEGRNREEVGGCDGSNYFGPRIPSSEGYGPKKSQGSICPLWTYHPKSLGHTNPLTLLSQQAYSSWNTNAALCPCSMEVPCQYQDSICY